ncbi:filamentous hemagglutinin N-terminal domain-containing protein [Alkalinema pantanalense CENA528]|uniref:two-partner secretion domain-containing protein n=1 Tax=Alkalinema pantanalense TaxID=1620705 RepID=UPI003D6EFDC1
MSEAIGLATPTFAQSNIVADPTVGTTVAPNLFGFPIEAIRGGAERGQNLFHSFQEFNVSPDRVALFLIPNNTIQNVFARVTGQNLSQIDGTVGTRLDGTFATSTANLFLMNPNGIIFSAGGRLDVGGSFVATTANAIKFGERGLFSASVPSSSNLLEINPSAFFFTALKPQPIVNQSKVAVQFPTGQSPRGLQVPNERSLLLVGGDVRLDAGGIVTAFDGRVELGGLSAPGTVGLGDHTLSLSFPLNVPRADVKITGSAAEPARVTVAGQRGGTLVINARNLDLQFGIFQAGLIQGLGTSGIRAGNIEIDATNQVTVGGIVPTGGFGISNTVELGARGDSGDINIRTGTLKISGGNQVSTSTISSGRGGNLTVEATSIELVGQDTLTESQVVTGITSNVFREATGMGGNITLTTQRLLISNGASIQTGTLSPSDTARGGEIIIKASEIEISGSIPTESRARSNIITGTIGGSEAGNLNITANRLVVQNSGIINTGTTGSSKGGNLSISTSELEVANAGIGTNSVGPGNSGKLEIKTGNLTLRDQAVISTSTLRSGQGGELQVNASGTIQLENTSIITTSSGGSGNAGNLEIGAYRLSIRGGSAITSETRASGQAGSLSISAVDFVDVTGTSANGIFPSSITSGTFGSGNASQLTIKTRQLSLQNKGVISSSSGGSGQAGDIDITTQSALLDNQAQIQTISLSGKGGNIQLTIPDRLLIRRGSQISTSSGSSQFNGDGGNIDIISRFIVAIPKENSDITANAFNGAGGNINITTEGIFGLKFRPQLTDLSDITASSQFGLNGTVILNAPDNSAIQNSLSQLPNNNIDTNQLLAQTCIVRQDQPEGTFYITGTGGIPNRPNDPALSTYPTNTIQSTTQTADRPWKLGDPIVEPQGFYTLADGRFVMSRECSQ